MAITGRCTCCIWHGDGRCACHGMPAPKSLEDQAEELARHISGDGQPPDAGAIAKLRGLVAAARAEGRAQAVRDVEEFVREWA